MSVYKRPLAEGEVLEDNRFTSLNTEAPKAAAVKEVVVEKEVVAPKAKKEKEVAPVEAVVEPVEIVDEKPLDMVVG